ncbi:hypothetical protein AVEN_270673-1 [Araneus ventricosus]|uniref:Uncharacterized protein n=1 Tax=Araneus ventricosus TaxID=182803 RepID=A0A4Y2RCV0_ARAVE|nr:hypothetical protein AVEN_270673-1 [Araneus ventricosus]
MGSYRSEIFQNGRSKMEISHVPLEIEQLLGGRRHWDLHVHLRSAGGFFAFSSAISFPANPTWHVFATDGRECSKQLARPHESRPQRVKQEKLSITVSSLDNERVFVFGPLPAAGGCFRLWSEGYSIPHHYYTHEGS